MWFTPSAGASKFPEKPGISWIRPLKIPPSEPPKSMVVRSAASNTVFVGPSVWLKSLVLNT